MREVSHAMPFDLMVELIALLLRHRFGKLIQLSTGKTLSPLGFDLCKHNVNRLHDSLRLRVLTNRLGRTYVRFMPLPHWAYIDIKHIIIAQHRIRCRRFTINFTGVVAKPDNRRVPVLLRTGLVK